LKFALIISISTSLGSIATANRSVSKQLVDYSRGHREAHRGAKRLKMAMDIVIISSTTVGIDCRAWRLVRRSRARSVGCFAAGFAKAHREQGDN